MKHSERRDSYRIQVDEGLVQLDVLPSLPAVRVQELSGSGGRIVMDASEVEELRRGPVAVQPEGVEPFLTRLEPVRTHLHRDVVELGVRFHKMDGAALASLSRFLLERHRLLSSRGPHFHWKDGLRLASRRARGVRDLILHQLIRHRRPLHVFDGQGQLPVKLRVQMLTVQAARQMMVMEVVQGHVATVREGEELTFAFAGYNGVNHFSTAIWRVGGDSLHVLVPADIRQVGFRAGARFRPPRVAPVVRMTHPRRERETLRRRLVDLSVGGFSVQVDPDRDVLFPGEMVTDVSIPTDLGSVHVDAIIRSVVPTPDLGICGGMEIVRFADHENAHRWARYVMSVAHPDALLGGPEHVGMAWDVLRKSGYVDLLDEGQQNSLEQGFRDTWRRLSRRGRDSRFLIVRRQSDPVGTASVSRLYPRTWMPHHFGIDEAERERKSSLFAAARSIYQSTMYVLSHFARCEYFVFYYDATKRWHDLLFTRFIQRCSRKTELIRDGFSLYRATSSTASSGPHGKDVALRLESDSAAHAALLADVLSSRTSLLERRAFSLMRDEITLEEFARQCAREGYHRSRLLVTATREDTPVATLVAEAGGDQVNIFNLMDRAWMVRLDGEGLPDPEVAAALLGEAARHYGKLGKTSFLVMGPPGGLPGEVVTSAGLSTVADGLRWVAHRSVIPAYMNYVEEILSTLPGQDAEMS